MPKPPLHPNTWLTWLGVLLLSGLRFLPQSLRRALAHTVARLYTRRNTAQRRAVHINLQACLPHLNEAQRQALYQHNMALQVRAAMLLPRQWWSRDAVIRDQARLHHREVLDKAIAEERPVVLLATHSVALDAGLMAVAPDYPLQGIYKPLKNPVLDWLVYRSRTRFNALPVSRGGGFRQLIKGLNKGVLLCYLSDEDLGPEGSVFAPFFGHSKATLAMLPRIVKHTNAVVIPMVAHLDAESDCIDVHFFEPLQGYPRMQALDDATVMNAAIEQTILLQPEQFLWKLRIFKTCPNGADTRYGQIERGELSVSDL